MIKPDRVYASVGEQLQENPAATTNVQDWRGAPEEFHKRALNSANDVFVATKLVKTDWLHWGWFSCAMFITADNNIPEVDRIDE
jgi:hypothetical protein